MRERKRSFQREIVSTEVVSRERSGFEKEVVSRGKKESRFKERKEVTSKRSFEGRERDTHTQTERERERLFREVVSRERARERLFREQECVKFYVMHVSEEVTSRVN